MSPYLGFTGRCRGSLIAEDWSPFNLFEKKFTWRTGALEWGAAQLMACCVTRIQGMCPVTVHVICCAANVLEESAEIFAISEEKVWFTSHLNITGVIIICKLSKKTHDIIERWRIKSRHLARDHCNTQSLESAFQGMLTLWRQHFCTAPSLIIHVFCDSNYISLWHRVSMTVRKSFRVDYRLFSVQNFKFREGRRKLSKCAADE